LLKTVQLNIVEERLCWLAFSFSFAVKMPLLPFHIWLPEAHCEAPTAGSVILAGILLKLGGYGFLRFSIGLFPESSAFFTPLIYLISILGVIYASITTLQQVDLKKIIAYSSVGHVRILFIINYI
jgi:NADH:ubiquinone oxidoreductase subunit 4 (subunit M)